MNVYRSVFAGVGLYVLATTVASPAKAESLSFAQLAGGSLTYGLSGVALQSSAPAASTGIFTSLHGTALTLGDLSFVAPGTIAVFGSAPGLSITATAMPGAFSSSACFTPAATGQSCTPPLAGGTSPLNLYNTTKGSVAAVSLALTIENGDESYAGTGILTLQFSESYQQVLNTLAEGGQLASSFSAHFDAGTAGSFSFGGGASLGEGIDLAAESTVGGLASGMFRVDPTSTGAFETLENTLGTSADLGVTADFLQFSADPSLGVDVTSLDAGAFSSAACFAPAMSGQTCTVPGAAFEFANIANGSVLSFSLDGVLTTAGGATSAQGMYSTQFVGRTYQQVLAGVLSGLDSTSVYSATFAAAIPPVEVPEPLCALMFGCGMIALWSRRARPG